MHWSICIYSGCNNWISVSIDPGNGLMLSGSTPWLKSSVTMFSDELGSMRLSQKHMPSESVGKTLYQILKRSQAALTKIWSFRYFYLRGKDPCYIQIAVWMRHVDTPECICAFHWHVDSITSNNDISCVGCIRHVIRIWCLRCWDSHYSGALIYSFNISCFFSWESIFFSHQWNTWFTFYNDLWAFW